MAKQKTTSIKNFFTIENAVDSVNLANRIALDITEKGFTKGFSLIEKSQGFTDKKLKKGFQFSAKQQDVMFDTLETSKEKVSKTFKKATTLFDKK